ncbi:asparagine synthase (glutamine-hydrolyzing) [Dactylosporangium sp. NPDC051541]|uniref:asparagine synthase (glutamine-hydrolyzing) n=1 Tax=Dactylosporangium sp. NPDC051541 TaxID=3363977 RepID=UPI0037954780
MCGIGGVARIDGGHLDGAADGVLERIAAILQHRGPDDRELLRDGPVGLAFTRLSLVDPEHGGQPLISADGSLALIVNGEIYNHRELAATLPAGVQLRTGSDCEVLLYLYQQHGPAKFLDNVRGMYSVVLYDRARRRLVLARDRFGIKALYFHRNAERIIFGSELKALFADTATPRRLDWAKALASPFASSALHFTDVEQNTWFEGVEVLPPGVIREIDLRDGATREHVYWRFPGSADVDGLSAAEFIERYRDLFVESVRECATADAELGLFLSGGIDSAAVAAVAAQTTPLHTFTMLSASTVRNGDAEHGHRLAKELGLPNHQILFAPDHVPTPAEWKRLLWLLENPMCGAEIYYKHEMHRYAKVARPELRGMLLGAASDEFNGGYSVGYAVGGGYDEFEDNLRGLVRAGALSTRPDLAPWWLSQVRLLNDDVVAAYTGRSVADPMPAYLAFEYAKLQQYNVWHEDRTAAGSGIEARVPFLDHRLVELVTAVPRHLRPELLWDKRILRAAMRGIVPPMFAERPKVPFFYGAGLRHTYRALARMLSQDGAALVEEALAAPGAGEVLNGPQIRAALARLTTDPGEGPEIELMLRVLNFGLLAAMVERPPAPTAVTPIGPCPTGIEVNDWDSALAEIEKQVGLDHELTPSAVLGLAANVLLLTGPDGTAYLTVDGTIEFELEPGSAELALLAALDGRRDLGAVLAAAEQDLAAARPVLGMLIEQSLIEDTCIADAR